MFIAPTSVLAETQTGIAQAVDGDSLTLNDLPVRLFGIDAPEYRQPCDVSGAAWECGEAAAAALRTIINGKQLTCIPIDRDVYGRLVAKCLHDGDDVAAAMVGGGMAIVLDNGSRDYSALQDRAKAAKLGIWRSKFAIPADYRAAQPPARLVTGAAAQGRFQSPVARGSFQFRSCAQARAAGAAPMYRGQASYNPNLDGDRDGVACEPYRGR